MRQLMKGQLSEMFLDENDASGDDLFDGRDLKDLFSVRLQEELNGREKGCVMHELMGCGCQGIGEDLDDDDDADADADDDDLSEDQEEDPQAKVAAKKSDWTSALLVKTQSDLDSELERRKTMKKCLVGYKHIHPCNFKEKDSDEAEDLIIDCGGDIVMENLMKDRKTRKLISYVMWKANKKLM